MQFWNFDWDEDNIDHIAAHGVDVEWCRVITAREMTTAERRYYRRRGKRKKQRRPITDLQSLEQIPEFTSEPAEAEFWQTHSPVKIFDQLPTAEVHFHRPAKRLIPLPLKEALYEELRRQAQDQGISPLTLIQCWIESRLERGKRRTAKKR